ncbi:MAG: sensor domain-containing diguanylate cyclase [Alkalibacterium sp.]|nr:sensor domain-containing diguanylate cyclase [Alkalibacterium sp.]
MNELQREIDTLKEELSAVKRLNRELLTIQQNQDSQEFSWTGNLGHWYWDFKANKVTFNPLKATALGFKKEELPEYVDFQFFTERLHPDDYERVMDEMRAHLAGKIPVWEVKYRIKTKEGTYKTYYDRGKVTERSADGAPLFLTGIVFDISEFEVEKEELLRKNKEWEVQSKRDKLTGLYNRSNILVKLGQVVQKVNAGKLDTVSLIVFDIDNLEHQNSLFGPLFGDELIRQAGAVIRNTLEETHFAGSFAGGKFLIVLPDTQLKRAAEIADSIRLSFHGNEYTEPAEVTSSAGIAEYQQSETVSQLFNRADRLLDKVKRNGKNQVLAD